MKPIYLKNWLNPEVKILHIQIDQKNQILGKNTIKENFYLDLF